MRTLVALAPSERLEYNITAARRMVPEENSGQARMAPS